MTLIGEEYLALQRELHGRGNYGVSGHRWADNVLALADKLQAKSILDYGCGKGMLGWQIRAVFKLRPLPFEYFEYDPAIEGKDAAPLPADLVVCGDVLEHIEPEHLEDVLDDLRGLARKAVFLVVSTQLAAKVLADGRNAHLIVKPSLWWLPKILDRWDLNSFQDRGGEFMAIGYTA